MWKKGEGLEKWSNFKNGAFSRLFSKVQNTERKKIQRNTTFPPIPQGYSQMGSENGEVFLHFGEFLSKARKTGPFSLSFQHLTCGKCEKPDQKLATISCGRVT